MLLLAVLALAGVVASILAVTALLTARRRLGAELTAARGAIALEQGARVEVKGLLDASQETRLRVEEEAREAADALRLELADAQTALEDREAALARSAAYARRAEEALAQERACAATEIAPLEREIARLAAESAAAEQRSLSASSSVKELEARLAALTASSATATQALTARVATLVAARAEAEEARRLAEEEARLARTTKESFAGEARLLREEVQKAQARLEQASRRSEAPPPEPSAVKVKELPLKRVITWWCVSCNEGGGIGPKPHVCVPSEKK